MAQRYFLKTDGQTYLFRGGDETLVHLTPKTRNINLSVELAPARGSSLVGFFRFGDGEPVVPVVTDAHPVGGIALRTGTGFLSPSPTGAFDVTAQILPNAVLSPVNVDDYQIDELDFAGKIGRSPSSRGIPKQIHQTYSSAAHLSAEMLRNIECLKDINPGWKYIFWSDADVKDFIRDEYGEVILRYYLRINPKYGAARADLFRYLCIYKFGGVYLDIKSGCDTPLDDIVRPDDLFLLSQWSEAPTSPYSGYGRHPELAPIAGGEYQQWHVVAAPGHPFLGTTINDVLMNIENYHVLMDGVGKASTLRVTGPIAYSLAINKLIDPHNHRLFDAAASGLVYRKVADLSSYSPTSYSRQTAPLIL